MSGPGAGAPGIEKTFLAVAEERPGSAWRAHFETTWPGGRRWYLHEGLDARPTAGEARAALASHMPELLPIYDGLCALAGGDEVAHRMLSGYNPPRVIPGCSQAVWTGPGGPALVRNYDFQVAFTTGIIESTRWLGRRAIAMREAAWGCLDGMNEDGLVASLTFGGRRAVGRGFSMPLILRYALETCRTVGEAVAALTRIPVAMAQNVTLLDRTGRFATVFVGADREPAVTDAPVCTNHQEAVVWPEMAATSRTVERHAHLAAELGRPATTLESLIEGMLRPPLHVFDGAQGFATVYTAVYRPLDGTVEYVWPGRRWRQGFDRFDPGRYTHRYGSRRPEEEPTARAGTPDQGRTTRS